MVAMIKELIDQKIRPGIQDDGGDLTYEGFVDGVVYVRLQGSCSTCSSSTITLKQGIERMFLYWLPEVTKVVAIDDDEVVPPPAPVPELWKEEEVAEVL